MKYLNPCLRMDDEGRYWMWERVIVRYQPVGVRRRYCPDDFAWVDVTHEFLKNEKSEVGVR